MSNTETKTETKTQKPSEGPQAQANQAANPANPFAAFPHMDPMAFWAQSQQMFRGMMADAINVAQTSANTIADRYAALDPMGYWASFRQAMGAAQAQASAQAGKLDAQYADLEAQLVDRAQTAVATWAQLANDAIAYGAKLSVEARKLGADAAKKMGATA